MKQPVLRLSGVLQDVWVDSDNVDVLIHGVLRTRNASNQPVTYEITLALRPDDATDISDAISHEVEQFGATCSAIDDHDVAKDEARDVA